MSKASLILAEQGWVSIPLGSPAALWQAEVTSRLLRSEAGGLSAREKPRGQQAGLEGVPEGLHRRRLNPRP